MDNIKNDVSNFYQDWLVFIRGEHTCRLSVTKKLKTLIKALLCFKMKISLAQGVE